MIRIRRIIEHITFQNSENGYSIMRAKVKDHTDLVSEDLRQCLHHLSEIIGEVTTTDVLHNIFKNILHREVGKCTKQIYETRRSL